MAGSQERTAGRMTMIAQKMQALFGRNWKTNLLGFISFLTSVQQFVQAVTAWSHGQPADWRAAIGALIIALVGFAAKDSSNKSTSEDVVEADKKAGIQSNAQLEALAEAVVGHVLSKTAKPQ
jgi:hypothetical protein